MIIYFSGTGNSRYCAQVLAAELNDEIVDAALYVKSGKTLDAACDKPWIFVSPIYGWQIPHIFADFIRRCNFGGSRKAYFVITCGSDIGSAEKYLLPLCAEKGFELGGVLEVVMPENYVAMFPVPNEAESAKIIAEAELTVKSAAKLIAQSKPLPKRRYRLFDNLKSGLVNKVFCRFFIKSEPFRITDKCIGCGKCAELCPLNGIDIKNGKPVWNGSCTHCMACICSCPTEAIEYGRKSIGKRRYLCPEYKGDKT